MRCGAWPRAASAPRRCPRGSNRSGAFAVDHADDAPRAGAQRAAAAWKPKVLTPAQNAAVIALSRSDHPADRHRRRQGREGERVHRRRAGRHVGRRTASSSSPAWRGSTRAPRATSASPSPRATAEQQTALLTTHQHAPRPSQGADRVGAEFFSAIKAMTITGYYTSEIGMREELGDDGQMFFAEFKGCTHPEHQGVVGRRQQAVRSAGLSGTVTSGVPAVARSARAFPSQRYSKCAPTRTRLTRRGRKHARHSPPACRTLR